MIATHDALSIPMTPLAVGRESTLASILLEETFLNVHARA
jgi:hypothetical protein